ncbi:unnamed protein product [Arctia plantaginis]|uniref:SUZ domain-containing protein n=1 Tax=Arctia plantaginis TaxID=874455 RepID=A0A8S0YYH3_ARCPL|nr:unnamed protein product [Arctia plantaginis]
MENAEVEKNTSPEENNSQLTRNRSFKSKQLVRSQAIRETASPPRAISPSPHAPSTVGGETNSEDSSHRCSDELKKKLPVEIQITSGGWDETHCEQRQRARRWLSDAPRDLLSNNPRVACVCGACACPNCRGRRRRHACPTKQDSGIVCSDDCPDCSDIETAGPNHEVVRKSCSVDVDDQMYYCRCPDRKERPKNMMLSRNDSGDYQKYERNEPTGPELVAFLKDTLNKNPRDRMALLKIEKELHSLVNDTGRCIVRFPVMTSYGRMLVHRCASLFQLSHHLDQANKTCVLVSKSGTCGGRIPCTSFKEWCTATFPPSPQRHQSDVQHAKSILKRDTNSLDETGAGSLASNRSKSLEQREKEYERVRRRIFSSQEEAQWPWLTSGPVKLLTPEGGGRNKLLKVQSLEGNGAPSNTNWRGRGAVSKSHSFGGYTGAEPPHQPRLLSRQGDLASSSWRLSPSSSGYKTLSLRSTDSITPSPTGGASPEPSGNMNQGAGPGVGPPLEGAAVVWAVTDMSSVPAGAVVIHPQTGRPLTNSDGSVYHFDPANPPVLYDPGIATSQDEQKQLDQNNEKRRGRLEKQQSFIDHECECQPTEECRNKCCCESRKHEACHQQQKTSEKETNTPSSPKPTTPITHSPQPTQPIQTVEPIQVQQQEPTNQEFETADEQKTEVIETPNQRTFENQKPFEVQKNYELTNQRQSNDFNRMKESQELQYHQYPQGYRPEEMTSPQQHIQNHYVHQDVTMQQGIQNKMTPIPMQDPNMRPMSMTNMMYPGPVAQGYPYHVRVDAPMQVYQQVVQPEEHKLTPSPHANEATFRIDPSYPYAAVDYTGAACGACVDTSSLQHQQRSYSVPYNQVEIPQVLPGPYPVGNMILPQPHLQPYPYQEPLQWGGVAPAPKLVVPELYPTMVPYPQPAYPHYNIVYPQVIPQPYPICQPIYPILDQKPPERRNSIPHARAKRNSLSTSSRNTPDKAAYEEQARQAEIAAKIQQIKSQMADLNVKDGGNRPERTERSEWKEGRRRNSGNGLLGNCPVNNFNGRVMGRSHDEAHLSSAARAIVNSIRNMQAKNNTYQDNRREYQRFDYKDRPRRQERDDKDKPNAGQSSGQDRYDVRARGLNVPLYRQPYLLRQVSPGAWCRRSPAPLHPVLNPPRRPHPDGRNPRR